MDTVNTMGVGYGQPTNTTGQFSAQQPATGFGGNTMNMGIGALSGNTTGGYQPADTSGFGGINNFGFTRDPNAIGASVTTPWYNQYTGETYLAGDTAYLPPNESWLQGELPENFAPMQNAPVNPAPIPAPSPSLNIAPQRGRNIRYSGMRPSNGMGYMGDREDDRRQRDGTDMLQTQMRDNSIRPISEMRGRSDDERQEFQRPGFQRPDFQRPQRGAGQQMPSRMDDYMARLNQLRSGPQPTAPGMSGIGSLFNALRGRR